MKERTRPFLFWRVRCTCSWAWRTAQWRRSGCSRAIPTGSARECATGCPRSSRAIWSRSPAPSSTTSCAWRTATGGRGRRNREAILDSGSWILDHGRRGRRSRACGDSEAHTHGDADPEGAQALRRIREGSPGRRCRAARSRHSGAGAVAGRRGAVGLRDEEEEGQDRDHQRDPRHGSQEREADDRVAQERAGARGHAVGVQGGEPPAGRRDAAAGVLGGRSVLARTDALREGPRRGSRGEGPPLRRGGPQARKRLLFVGRWQLPRRRDQAGVGQEAGGARDVQAGPGGSPEGAGGPSRKGAQGGSPAGGAAGLSANPGLPTAAGGSYRVETWGCQMNVLDGERMAGQLERLGLSAAVEASQADVVVLNTCSVRDKADQKVYSALGVLAERKRDNPGLVIGVAGCLAQVTGDEILERAPWVDFVLGTGNVERVGEVVERVRRDRRRESLREMPEDSPVYQFRQISRGSRFQAYLTVIEGCDQFCTFCIVPFPRGRERSRRSPEILEEAAWLVSQGYTEITLPGQTVNAY